MKKQRGLSLKGLQVNFKNVKKVFPQRYTKLRMPTDLFNLVDKNARFMTGKEIFKIKNILESWDEDVFEVYAVRNKKGIKLVPFDVEN